MGSLAFQYDVHGRPTALRFGIGVLAAVVAFSTATLLPPVHRLVAGTVGYELLQDGGHLLAAVLVGARALTVRRARRAWALLALGLLLYAFGNVYYYAVLQHLDPVPSPSWADALWLSLYPLLYVAVGLLLRRDVLRWHASIWLDGLVAALGVATIAVALVLDAVPTTGPGGRAALVVNLAYPVADLLLLSLIAAVPAVLGRQITLQWWLLGMAMAAFAVADTMFLLDVANETFAPGAWYDNLWLLALLGFVLAAWARRPERPPAELSGWRLFAVPGVFACTSLVVALWAALTVGTVPSLASGLAAATIAVALGRMALTSREVSALAQARREARTDDLTGLPNRRLFLEELERSVQDAPDGRGVAVLMVDLDRFKEVNDSFGHQVGDDLLRLLAPRIVEVVRGGAVLARLGGDEFGVLLVDADVAAAEALADEVADQLRIPFALEGMLLHVAASVGIAISPDHGTTPATLLRHADIAMYAAKRGRTGKAVFDERRDGGSRERLEVVEQLRTALVEGQLVLHYQPKLDLRSGQPVGVEALVRWQHPERGLLYPDAFLPLAEQAGLMASVTLQILERALHDLRRWREHAPGLTVAVNLSPSNLADRALPGQVADLLAATRVPAEALVLEITEDMLIGDVERATEALAELATLGLRLAVDDYGTGYSSLAYLRVLPVHELKLDRSFVMPMSNDPRAAAIVRSTIGLSHDLGMRMVAEGVEDEPALASLHSWGCDEAQGFHIARPMPAQEVSAWMERALVAPAAS